MKRIIVLLGIVLPVYVFSMDQYTHEDCLKYLLIMNNTNKIATIKYEPKKDKMREGMQSERVTKCVDAGKFRGIPPLLTPLISVAIDGFTPLENLPIVKTHVPLVIHPPRDNEIAITQDTETRAILKALINTHQTPQVKSVRVKPVKKEDSDEDCCVQ